MGCSCVHCCRSSEGCQTNGSPHSFAQVNNAGVAKRAVNVENVDLVMQTNYFGVKNVTQALLPLFRPSSAGSRVVIVASRLGLLRVLILLTQYSTVVPAWAH